MVYIRSALGDRMSNNISPKALLSPGCDPVFGKLIEWLPVRYKNTYAQKGHTSGQLDGSRQSDVPHRRVSPLLDAGKMHSC